MKIIITYLFLIVLPLFSQQIPNLPIPIGAGSAEVYNGKIYYFGGSNNWSGSILYDSVFVYDGVSWELDDIIPDKNLWDVETVRVGNEVYLISGWPSGPHFLRKYNLDTKNWTYLANSPNTTTWGVTAEHWNGYIFLFLPNGDIHEYSIQNNEWTTKTKADVNGPLNLSSIIYQEKIYVIGYNDSTFFRYDPSSDGRLILSKSLYQVGASAMGIINDQIYCVGGNPDGSRYATYKSILVYSVTNDEWALDSLEISSKRHWMATAEYEGGLYVLGGIDSTDKSVNIVEEIVPQGTAVGLEEMQSKKPDKFQLFQNYPNPFNPQTTIEFNISQPGFVSLRVFDMIGREVKTLVSKQLSPGLYKTNFEGNRFSSGIYFYSLQVSYKTGGFFESVQKMILMK
ncbi:MAG: T9SS C-terminal target domain-containing protein [Calditrichaeota bacterium]|nr:MAG: T9SS C-terminal target domain-containing protein [Calditrichota bacterium]MBL1204948.1 T9SS C-terminal target domain-containing protein [Calditrichota bacterium]NOG44777.1 T9SS type A sorting domain-containing protein [Calditrichota bacterium]